eukprot:196259-Pyramimonas_sp.AAC.2
MGSAAVSRVSSLDSEGLQTGQQGPRRRPRRFKRVRIDDKLFQAVPDADNTDKDASKTQHLMLRLGCLKHVGRLACSAFRRCKTAQQAPDIGPQRPKGLQTAQGGATTLNKKNQDGPKGIQDGVVRA